MLNRIGNCEGLVQNKIEHLYYVLKFLNIFTSLCFFLVTNLFVQVRDYRKCRPDQGTSSSADGPVVNKVWLRMSLENVVKDIPLLSDDSWTYSDLMVSISDL